MGSSSSARPRRRRPRASRHLLGASLMVLVGAFLPWVSTGVGNVVGVRGAGLWTMYAAVFGVAGALIPHRRLAGIHAGLLAIVATALPLWQVVHLLGKVGLEGWMPGVGLVLTFGGGVVAGFAAVTLLRSGAEQPSRA